MSGELVEAFLEEPMRYLRTTYMALFRPTEIARTRITLDDKKSLRSAVAYWFSSVAVVLAISGLSDLFFPLDLKPGAAAFGLEPFARFMEVVRNSTILSEAVKTLLFVAFFLFWYWALRLFVSRHTLSLTNFVQCAAYPSGAVLVLSSAVLLLNFIILKALPIDPDGLAAILHAPILATGCADPSSVMCRDAVLGHNHPHLHLALLVGSYAITYGIAWWAISSIIKEAAGVSRRTTLGALVLLMAVTVVLYLAGVGLYVSDFD